MRSSPRLRAAGLAVLAVGLAAAGCTLPGRVEGPVQLTATFDDVGDLVSGHSVQVADVRVGSIDKIELTDDYKATVTMKVKEGLELPGNSTAVLRTTSLLGEKFVEIRAPREGEEGPCDADPAILVHESSISCTAEAPELEFVAEEAVNVLAGVAHEDLATMIETGGVGFGGRAAELGSLIDSLSAVSSTLADQTGNIVSIIDGLDRASATLAGGSERIDALLVNLSRTTEVLADNRELTLQTLRDLTRMTQAQNELVFEPYRADVERQVQQLDAILALVAERREEVGILVDWLAEFTRKTPLGIPDDFAQVYGWFELPPLEDGA
ncbi:MAG: MCE family protein [Acidimicrobiales bacterium]|nr:MCE family protein [Acidimicrobiales bacterium]